MSAEAAKMGFDMIGSIATGMANSKAAKAQAKVAEMNRDIALRQNALDVSRQRQRNRFNAGANRASVANSGLTFDGSAVDIMNSNAVQDELDVLLTKYEGDKAAWGYSTGAAFARAESNNAMVAGFLNAGSKLAQGYSDGYLSGNKMPGAERYNSTTGSNGAPRSVYKDGTTITWNR